mgnify:FL=1
MLEFLTESDFPDSVKDVIDVIGIDAFKGLVKLAGGSLLYIPNESNLVKPIRNRRIREEFKGSYRDISMKYGISEVQVRNIINKEWIDFIIDLFWNYRIKINYFYDTIILVLSIRRWHYESITITRYS